MTSMVIMLAVALLVAAPAAYAASYTVGDGSGWDTGVTYSDWAANKTFNVGDTLVFNYLLNHAVDVVSAADYKSCSSASPIKSYTGGATTITLSTSGPWYFICPTSNHCATGQALSITVVDATTPSPPVASASPPPPGTTTAETPPPSSTSSPSPPPPSSTSSPPPPAGKAGALVVSSVTYLVCVVFVVLMSV